MIELSKKLEFKFTWRSYQERFLDNFESHVRDNHLHLVAPPGSGKTILGLEMIRRVNKTCLVLAPNLTIRNQWKSRLESFFLTDKSFGNYTLNIKTPSLLTFSTYQSLHSLEKSLIAKEQTLVDFIHKNAINTIVLDEAHHLKNEWWKSLIALKQIEGLTIISLTATPPYDSNNHELNKYFELCGPLDDEIAVPDLIKNGDLCPHQDFVYFSKPDKTQIQYIVSYREQIIDFNNKLLSNSAFNELLLDLPIYVQSEKQLEAIYENPKFFSAVLIFLNAAGHQIESKKLEFLGFNSRDIDFPSLTYEWLEILLQQLLVDQRESLKPHEKLMRAIEIQLAKIGVFEKKQVNFVGDEHLYRTLVNSPSKLKSISDILKAESESLGAEIKAVVLTDFIRKEYLDFDGSDISELNKLGVVSIFQYLRTTFTRGKDIAVLTGSLVILHKKAAIEFKRQFSDAKFNLTPMFEDDEFVVVNSFGNAKSAIVGRVTQLFQKGVIKILIGTKSLLGEGWDAPAINTLILASYVGSFVSSNQMRGRAIRIDPNCVTKTGNIWHLACLDPTDENGGKDFEKLQRRFEAFSGVSVARDAFVENGLERLNLPDSFSHETDLEELNIKSVQLACKREDLKARWFQAISKGNVLVREVKVPYLDKVPFEEVKKLRWGNVSKFMFIEVLVGVGLFFPEFLAKNLGILLSHGVFQFLYAFLAAIFIGFAPKTYKAIKLYFLFGNTYKKTRRIGTALLKVMARTNVLRSAIDNVCVVTEQQSNGTFVCYLKGASNAESGLFVNLLAEILAPVENPRYLLVYKHWIMKHWNLRTYYVVPQLYGRRKEDAQLFHKYWRKHVDSSALLYTRTVEGRKSLLKARLSHILFQFKEVSKKAITWK